METVKTRVHFLTMETRRHPPRVQDGVTVPHGYSCAVRVALEKLRTTLALLLWRHLCHALGPRGPQ